MASKPPYAPGAQVEHGKFGLGSVISCTDEYLVIKFDDHGEKKFVTSMVLPSLKKSDRTPPPEKRASRARKKVAAPAPAPAPVAAAVAVEEEPAVDSESASAGSGHSADEE